MPGPLAGIRILDCSAVISGPLATMMLADQGADVIKVEPPGAGDITRTPWFSRGGIAALFANANRGKRSLALDLRDERGRDILKKLVARADARRAYGRSDGRNRSRGRRSQAPAQ